MELGPIGRTSIGGSVCVQRGLCSRVREHGHHVGRNSLPLERRRHLSGSCLHRWRLSRRQLVRSAEAPVASAPVSDLSWWPVLRVSGPRAARLVLRQCSSPATKRAFVPGVSNLVVSPHDPSPPSTRRLSVPLPPHHKCHSASYLISPSPLIVHLPVCSENLANLRRALGWKCAPPLRGLLYI